MHVFDWFYELNFFVLYPLTIIVLISAGEIGIYLGRRRPSESEFGTPTGAALGLLALLLAFSVSLSVGRFDDRRRHVLEEADAISSTANFALMLPQQSQAAILPSCTSMSRCGSALAYRMIRSSSTAMFPARSRSRPRCGRKP